MTRRVDSQRLAFLCQASAPSAAGLPGAPWWAVTLYLTAGPGEFPWLPGAVLLLVHGAILGAAETYLLVTRLTGWDLDAYENWLVTTWTRLSATAPGS